MSIWRHRRTRSAGTLLLFALLTWPVTARAQANPAIHPDTLFVTGERIVISPGSGGVTGGVEWLHAIAPTRSINAGVLTFRVGDSLWTYGRIGTMWPVTESTSVRVQTDVGAGRDANDRFPYFTVQGAISHDIVTRRLTLEAGHQYVHIHTTAGHSGRVGVAYRAGHLWTIGAAFHSSFGTSLGVRAATLRIARDVRLATIFGGLSSGTSRPALIGTAATGAPADVRELYGGAIFPIGRFSLTAAISALDTNATRKRSFVLSWKLPLP